MNGEYDDNKREMVDLLTPKVMQYDILSFDIFDTIIFRNVNRPEDIFELVGERIGVSGFAEMRISAEKKAISNLGDAYTLDDIYSYISQLAEIDIKKALSVEVETEIEFSTVNPYIYKVYQKAVKCGKKVIFVSDMYLSKSTIESILKKNGVVKWDEIYISCEMKKSKSTGSIYKHIKELHENESIIHIGDNYRSDYENAKKHGINAYYYKNIRAIGEKYRNCSNSISLGMSVCNSLINQTIHNGEMNHNIHWQYGYCYGGPLVSGYCQWLDRMKKNYNIDRFLFLSRDTDVIFKAYCRIYEESDSQYIYTSRNAVFLLTIDRYLFYYVDVLKKWNLNRQCSVKKFLDETGLAYLFNVLEKHGINENDKLYMHFDQLIELIYLYKKEIYDSLKEMRENAKAYFKQAMGDCKRIGLVDIGWRGSIYVCLKYFLQDVCNFDVDIYCFQLGTNRQWINKELYDNSNMLSYCFSSSMNKEFDYFFSHEVTRMAIVELIFSAKSPTLFSYGKENVKNGFIFGEENHSNDELIDSMQMGILDFVTQFNMITKKMTIFEISGFDAMSLIVDVTKNKKYIHRLFDQFLFSEVSSNIDEHNLFKDFLKSQHY
ncbi:MAG: HAD family hydrolase [Lachnospiraceae bacterium]